MKGAVLALVAAVAVSACAADGESFRKKVIVCSWDFGNFTVADVLSNKAAVAALPVDGVRLSAIGPILPNGKPLNPWQAFSGTNDWPEGILAPLVPQFREATAIPSLRHSFTTFLLARGRKTRLDFRDDAGWATAFANVRQLAELARDGGLKGLVMDPEDYGKGEQFVRQDGDPPYEETARLARRRGQEFARTVLAAYPDMVLFTFWAFSQGRQYLTQPDPAASMRAKGELYLPFLDGVLDAIPPGVRIVDGDETSYNYSAYGRDGMNYAEKACANRACIAFVSPENRAKFRAQVLVGNAVYLDRYTNKKGARYYTKPVSGSRLHAFDENLCGAMRAADEYTWLWCEKFAWIDWKVHGKPLRRIAFAEHRTWDDEVPGMYDSIWAARDPRDFLNRRFPEIRGVGDCTNLVARGATKVSGKEKYGRQLFRLNVKRGERYVLEYTSNRAVVRGSVNFFAADVKRQWGLRTLSASGEGTKRFLVRVPQYTESISLGVGKPDDGETAEISGIGAYRLPAPMEPEDEAEPAKDEGKKEEKGK